MHALPRRHQARCSRSWTRICRGRGHAWSDLDELERLAGFIKDTSLCGLGQTAPNPVLSTLRYFRDEYEAHIGKALPGRTLQGC